MSVDQSTSKAVEAVEPTEVRVRGGALLDALAAVRPFTSRRKGAEPHERGVKLSFDDQGGALSCETGALSLRVAVPEMEAEMAGQVWVDHEGLKRAVGAYAGRRGPSSRVKVGLSVRAEEVAVTDGTTSAAIVRTLEEVPMPPSLARVPGTFVLDRAPFAEQSAAVAVAAECPTAPAVPILTAVRIESGHMLATDRYRLANMPLQGGGDLEGGAQPEARLLAKVMAAATGETVSIGVRGEVMTVHADNLIASLDMQTGDFPRVGVITRGFEESATVRVSAAELHAALAPYLKGCGTARVTLTTAGRSLEIKVHHGDGQRLAASALTARSVEGDPAAVMLNVEYLLDAVKIAGARYVEMRINGPMKPVMITSTDQPDRYCIIQPVRPAGG